ncbi:hypothetical protein CDAR_437991 [Caerostris darwini]|uniref:Uncharacterized protein n=1 Tax=Caerostris darwini TaxID=1538125 RepID=A0AAV4TVI9_9ARAC|nr:hypothetical protein CDAR_437991 [Caerostris darwini]
MDGPSPEDPSGNPHRSIPGNGYSENQEDTTHFEQIWIEEMGTHELRRKLKTVFFLISKPPPFTPHNKKPTHFGKSLLWKTAFHVLLATPPSPVPGHGTLF